MCICVVVEYGNLYSKAFLWKNIQKFALRIEMGQVFWDNFFSKETCKRGRREFWFSLVFTSVSSSVFDDESSIFDGESSISNYKISPRRFHNIWFWWFGSTLMQQILTCYFSYISSFEPEDHGFLVYSIDFIMGYNINISVWWYRIKYLIPWIKLSITLCVDI